MKLEYEIIHSPRRTVRISVERDRKVIVRAPMNMSRDRIDDLVAGKKMWLYEKLSHGRKYPAEGEQKEFVNGEMLLYLGRHYALSVVGEEGQGVELNHRFRIARADQQKAATLFRKWYRERAREIIVPRAEYFARRLGTSYNKILITNMRYRWGSCTLKNNLNFNWRIVKAPSSVIDYIIVHELAHLIESNHTPQFWNIVAVQVPKYEKAKEWLKRKGQALEVDF